jgi:hypothetical protein
MARQLFVLVLVSLSYVSYSQQPDTLIKKLDSLSKKSDSTGKAIVNTNPQAYEGRAELNSSSYFILLGSDLKQAFTKPFHMKSRDWKYLGLFTAGAVGVSLADKPVQQFALRLRKSTPDVGNVGRYVTNFGGLYELYTLGAFGLYGFVFKNEKMKTTTLLASQAYITGAAVQAVVKSITGRERPYTTNPDSIQASPSFHGPTYKGVKDINNRPLHSSFPSGHTTVAFAAATVFAIEYKNRPWIPVFAYSAATLIGLSRITENKHWASDVLVGAALGYLTGRQVSNNFHRYATIRNNAKPKKGSVSLNLQYSYGTIMPGIVYRFR